MPGSLTATVIRRPIDVQEGLNATPAMTGSSPLVYYYGYPNPLDKPKLYRLLIERLAAAVQTKLSAEGEGGEAGLKTAGCIINASSALAESAGHEHLHHIITHFAVSVVLVIGNERLHSELHRAYGDRLALIKLAKSGGVVNRDRQARRLQENLRIRQYFYGSSLLSELSPHSSTVSFMEIAVRKVGEGSLAPSSALPIGELGHQEVMSIRPFP
jgi:polyribonucleotide 5'-hydroxyl-kinase